MFSHRNCAQFVLQMIVSNQLNQDWQHAKPVESNTANKRCGFLILVQLSDNFFVWLHHCTSHRAIRAQTPRHPSYLRRPNLEPVAILSKKHLIRQAWGKNYSYNCRSSASRYRQSFATKFGQKEYQQIDWHLECPFRISATFAKLAI
jgi:hypothetical protein